MHVLISALCSQDDYATFKRVYETPILHSRAPDCTAKEAEVGEARIAQAGKNSLLLSTIQLICTV